MNTGSDFIIYGLVDPRSAEVRYIGQSTSGLHRPNTHAAPSSIAKCPGTHKSRWLMRLRNLGLRHGIVVLEELTDASALNAAECFWIAQGRGLGWRLTNSTSGGEGCLGFSLSDDAREKLGRANRGRKHTQAAIEAIRAASSGRVWTKEQIAKRVATRRLKGNYRAFPPMSPEARRRAVESRRASGSYGLPMSDATREKLRRSTSAYWARKRGGRKCQ